MSASTTKKSNKKSADVSPDIMDPQAQLREIQQLLFGQQVAEVRQTIENLSDHNEKQFAEMDRQITRSIKELKTHLTDRLDDLSAHVTKLNEEAQNRDALLEGEISTLQQDLDAFQKQTVAAQDSLEAQLFSEAEKLAADMEGKYKDVLEKLGSAKGDLSDRKTDRKTLAELLVNMANSLEGEPS
ncbi:hypothetical protein [Alkalimarinus coralli]|uniref:hypothetical protein n=1 Tax=Alkalimarinus coralli TaxID=2935863 RepID=UPI00202AE9C7|nr:hypothetical protein [Alkalimarinus coralli]